MGHGVVLGFREKVDYFFLSDSLHLFLRRLFHQNEVSITTGRYTGGDAVERQLPLLQELRGCRAHRQQLRPPGQGQRRRLDRRVLRAMVRPLQAAGARVPEGRAGSEGHRQRRRSRLRCSQVDLWPGTNLLGLPPNVVGNLLDLAPREKS